MNELTVYIDPAVDLDLSRRADALGKSKAEVIREALAREAAKAPKRKRVRAIGVGNGPGDVADNPDRYLRATTVGEG